MNITILKSVRNGTIAALILLGIYILIVSLVSGWSFMLDQFAKFWYYVVALAIGFGVQIGLYTYLKSIVREQGATRGVVAVSGTTSTVAMVSCCTHYLTNILPVLAIGGIATLVTQYQIQLFWVGLLFNILGIIYMVTKVRQVNKHL